MRWLVLAFNKGFRFEVVSGEFNLGERIFTLGRLPISVFSVSQNWPCLMPTQALEEDLTLVLIQM